MGILKSLLRSTFSGKPPTGDFLDKAKGVVHVGANIGQERDIYAHRGLNVIWVEPIPEVFDELQANLQGHSRQRAFQELLTDRDGVEYAFHVANNAGRSSSILEFKLHKDIWPEVAYERTIVLRSLTLATLLAREDIEARQYDALVMDTQGSELLVLKGATPVLHRFRFIKTEVSDFESYSGCCQIKDIDVFLGPHGFREISRHQFAMHPEGGAYYDIVYENQRRGIGGR